MKYLLISIILATGCLDTATPSPDPQPARATIDPAITAPQANAIVLATSCDYTEADDLGNDYEVDPADHEDSGLGVGTICGVVNSGHLDAYYGSIDIDDYVVTVPADIDLRLTFVGGVKPISDGPGMVGIFFWNEATGHTIAGGWFRANVGAFATYVPAGSYELSVEAYSDDALSTSIPYALTVDAPF